MSTGKKLVECLHNEEELEIARGLVCQDCVQKEIQKTRAECEKDFPKSLNDIVKLTKHFPSFVATVKQNTLADLKKEIEKLKRAGDVMMKDFSLCETSVDAYVEAIDDVLALLDREERK